MENKETTGLIQGLFTGDALLNSSTSLFVKLIKEISAEGNNKL